jgi:MFS family permease
MAKATLTTAPESPPSLSPFAVFHNRYFSRMWTGQLVSTMGSALTSLAASILVFRLTHSAMSVGLMLMATAAPSLLVGLFAGVLVDRFDRKWIMISADLIRAVLVFLIPFLVPHNIIWLYVIVLLSSAIGQFFDPAQESVLPEVASEQELAAGNSLMAISAFGSTAIGFAASGLIAGEGLTGLLRALWKFLFLQNVLHFDIPSIFKIAPYWGGLIVLVLMGYYLIAVPLKNAGAADEPPPPSAII